MKNLLNFLFEGQALSSAQAKEALRNIAQGLGSPCQVAAFLAVYRMREPSVDELGGFREAMLELATPLDVAAYKPVDLCGTGGDGKNTFNVSTTAAFVVAGAGAPVVKHGNYGSSSTCGSSNVLEALGIPFPTTEAQVRRMLDHAGIAFLHAPLWHPAMKNVAPVRKELAVKTVFNILGPLSNPARPTHQLVGVYNRGLLKLYGALLERGTSRYAVVHSIDGYDEVSLTSEVVISTREGEKILHAEAFGLSKWQAADLLGGSSVSESAKICLDVLLTRGTQAQEEVVVANAALALSLTLPTASLPECVERCREALRSGKAHQVLSKLKEIHV